MKSIFKIFTIFQRYNFTHTFFPLTWDCKLKRWTCTSIWGKNSTSWIFHTTNCLLKLSFLLSSLIVVRTAFRNPNIFMLSQVIFQYIVILLTLIAFVIDYFLLLHLHTLAFVCNW